MESSSIKIQIFYTAICSKWPDSREGSQPSRQLWQPIPSASSTFLCPSSFGSCVFYVHLHSKSVDVCWLLWILQHVQVITFYPSLLLWSLERNATVGHWNNIEDILFIVYIECFWMKHNYNLYNLCVHTFMSSLVLRNNVIWNHYDQKGTLRGKYHDRTAIIDRSSLNDPYRLAPKAKSKFEKKKKRKSSR